jgi:hypothetical protein
MCPFVGSPGRQWAELDARVRYLDGWGVLRQLLQVVTSQGFTIDEISTDTAAATAGTYPALGHGTACPPSR